MSATLYDLLGVDPAAAGADALAAAKWPNDRVNATEGINLADDSERIVKALQEALVFDNVRAGADRGVHLGAAADPGGGVAGQVSLAAEMRIRSSGPPPPTLYLRDMPNVGIQLLPTSGDATAMVFFAADGRGHELLVENLPVELQLPGGLIEPDKDALAEDGNPNDFDAGDDDSLAIVKRRDPARTGIYTHIRLHLRPDGDVVLEPNTPVSIDGAKISGFPVTALHDVLLIPSPRQREYFEWARNDLTPPLSEAPVPGAIGFRAIGFDLDKKPFKELGEKFKDSHDVQPDRVDLVLEDVVIPVAGGVPFPIPSHGTFGVRRKITDRHDIAQAYSLKGAPFRLRVYSRDGHDDDGQGLYLFIDELLFKTGSTRAHSDEAPVLEFQAGLYWQEEKGTSAAGTFGVGDDWTVKAGFSLGDSPWQLFTIADKAISLHGIQGGLRLRQLDDAANAWEVLADLSVHDTSASASTPKPDKPPKFEIKSMSGKPLDIVLRDVGWSFGHPTFGKSLAAPEGVQLIFAGFIRLIMEELGWVEEPAGGTYFSFSGGVSLGHGGGEAKAPTGERKEEPENGAGIRFRRLRFRTSNTPSAPPWKIDGIFLNISYGPVKIAGFGYISDERDSDYRYEEFGFGAEVKFPVPTLTLSVAAMFLKGARHALANPAEGFEYFLASLQVSWIPAGPVGLYGVRALFAYNMQPALDPPGEAGQSMVLYQWHKDHDDAIEMPHSRNLAAWKPVDRSLAVGAGAGFSLNSCGEIFRIGAFVLVTHSEEDTGILVVGDVYLLKNPEPIAFAAIEYDSAREKFGIMAGVDLTLSKFVGEEVRVPDWLGNVARLSGTIYFGNEPWMLAIGQLADQRTWLGISLNVPLIDAKLRLAVGLQITDGGPKGFGVVFAISGGADWGIGSFIVFGGFGFIIGTWKTGSDASGIRAWLELGFKIKVFYIFGFGADIKVDLTYLGKHPWYATIAAEIHVDTPWFLPDVTFRFAYPWGESLPFDTSTVVTALSGGSSQSPQAPGTDGEAPLLVPPLSDGNADPSRLYSFNQLAATSGAALEDLHLREDLPPVAVDADVAIDFTNPLANDAAIASDTYPGGTDLGLQAVQDMTVRYALKSVAIQRSPRFGPGAGAWANLVAAVDTELDLSGGGSVQAMPAVSFRWDADARADGVLAPKRLLVNSRTPFSLVVGSTRNDEGILTADPGLPCCERGKGTPPKWHLIDYSERPIGVRLGAGERFSEGGEWWRWTAPPVTVLGSQAEGAVAGVITGTEGTVGSVEFSSPAYIFELRCDQRRTSGRWTLEGYRGLELVDMAELGGTAGNPARLRGKIDAGLTRVVLRAHPGELAPDLSRFAFAHQGSLQGLGVVALDYLTCAEAQVSSGRLQRCRSGAELAPAVGGGGKLAFLPNHDYAVTATVEVTVSHKTGGTKSLTLSQPAYFRTKGLLGLNASANVGDELRPYVAQSYPAGGSFPLYRSEPVALAFTEDISNLLPVDRVPAPGDPPEKAQLMELTLCVERVASTEGMQRLTAPSEDWLTAHGGTVIFVPLLPLGSGGFVRLVVRRSTSLDPRVLRYEALLDAGGCSHDPLHSSQVLLHEPIGPDGSPGAWEGQAGLRAAVRAKDAPYTERKSFEQSDLGAFEPLADGGIPGRWGIADGALAAPGGGRAYAAFGEPSWNHYTVVTRFDPAGAAAGVAIGVSGSTPVQQALLALVEPGALVLLSSGGGGDRELARAPLSPASGPLELQVTAFDDRVRAQVGDVVVEAERGRVREGRAALVAIGAASFQSLLVDGLELYRVPFQTSRYATFVDHVAARDPALAVQAPDAMGAPAARTPAQVLAADGAAIAATMTATADPQARQELFAGVLSDLGLPSLERCDRLTFTRLADGGGTGAILLESPEPISFVHDVTAALAHRTWHRLPWWVEVGDLSESIHRLIPHLQLSEGQLLGPPELNEQLAGGHQLVHVAATDPARLEVFDPVARQPHSGLVAERSAILDQPAAQEAGLGVLLGRPAGTVAAVRPDRTIAGVALGPWVPGSLVQEDVPVPFTLLANGGETAALLLFSPPLAAGTYILTLTLDRTRWTSATADPESRYHDEATVPFAW